MEAIVEIDHDSHYEEALEQDNISEHSEQNNMVRVERATSVSERKDGRVKVEFDNGDEFEIGAEGTATPGASIIESYD